jgi:uncharacterized protein YbcC (UPF0753/DUF2309 family)
MKLPFSLSTGTDTKIKTEKLNSSKISPSSSLKKSNSSLHIQKVIKDIKKYLPAQAPLKDFIFQNNLEAFQNFNFFKGLQTASEVFGYKVFLSVDEFRSFYKEGRIREDVLEKIISDRKGAEHVRTWKEKLLYGKFANSIHPRIGSLKSHWNDEGKFSLDSMVHPLLFRMICSYLDQGISIWNFPLWNDGFLLSVKEMESKSFTSFFKTARPRKFLLEGNYKIEDLLKIVVGDEAYYEQYLFDQQFAHQGWSGMVSVIESHPETLMDRKKITLEDIIILELLLEIDVIDEHLGTDWKPLASRVIDKPLDLFTNINDSELQDAYIIWQEAFEWTYYNEVLAGLIAKRPAQKVNNELSFQAMFCIDDREASFRDYLERTDEKCETFSTPGFFNVEFYFQPEQGKAFTKLCPAPVTPKYLIKEEGTTGKRAKDPHLSHHTFLSIGWFISQVMGYFAVIELAMNIFKPSMGAATTTSFNHMNKFSKLSIQNTDLNDVVNGLQVGFTIEEMATRVEGLLRSIGLLEKFAPIIYTVGHGASSANNPFYATMDCGACSCRPGSVNARAFCFMANHPKVREILFANGINIPKETQFLGGLHDTTRDEILFYDENLLSAENTKNHKKNLSVFTKALQLNSKERSRRFELVNTKQKPEKIHRQILIRSISLFEPRPELDHATNALTIIAKRDLTKNLFLDRRALMNSYDYKSDPDGKHLLGVMKPVAPVCGGINLSYYFSRVDNQKLGAGTKLPHNVMGLFGVANGIDGDLRPGLPKQMIESHDPVRQMVIVEHFPEVVLEVVKSLPTYEWYLNEWMHLVALNPETKELSLFKDGAFSVIQPLKQHIDTISDMMPVFESTDSQKNIPVHIVSR